MWAAHLSHRCEKKKRGWGGDGAEEQPKQRPTLLLTQQTFPVFALGQGLAAAGNPDVDGPGSVMGEWMGNQQLGQREGLWDPEGVIFSLPYFSVLWASPDFIPDKFSPCF